MNQGDIQGDRGSRGNQGDTGCRNQGDRGMTDDEFEQRFGFRPEMDDVARVECSKVGQVGHQGCGVCETHDQPRFMCGCRVPRTSVNL